MEITPTKQDKGGLKRLPNGRFWTITCIFSLITVYLYVRFLGIGWFASPMLVSLGRLLFLVPVFYSATVFSYRGGFVALLVALGLMLPEAAFSSTRVAGLIESFAIFAIGGAGLFGLRSLEVRQKEQLNIAGEMIDRAQRKVQSKVRESIEHEKRLSTVSAFSAMLTQSLEIKQVIQTAVDIVMEIMHVEVVLLYSLDENTEELKVVTYQGVSPEFVGAVDRVRLGEGFNGRVAKTGEPLVVEDTSNDPRLTRQAVIKEGLHAQLIVPLISRGKIIGTLCAATRSPRQFKAAEVDLLAAMGNQVGIALENSRLYQEQIETTERLKRSEEGYRRLFESAHDAIWVQDLSGRISTGNNAFVSLVNFGLTEVTGRNIREFLSAEGLRLSDEVCSKLLRGEELEQPYEQKLIRRDGKEVVVMITTNLLMSERKPIGFQNIARDITAERRMQENLRFYVKQITQAQEEERQRIARDLHDSSAQSLIAMIHQLENFYRDRTELSMKDSRFHWNLQVQLKEVLQEIRQYSRDLRPSILDDLGLLPSIEWLAGELKREHKMQVNVEVVGQEPPFIPETKVSVFRIVQEAIRNIVKHAGATRVSIGVRFTDLEAVISITDNGRGFEMPKALGELPRTGKLGLVGMQERAKLAGGNLSIQSVLGSGTTLRLSVPVDFVRSPEQATS